MFSKCSLPVIAPYFALAIPAGIYATLQAMNQNTQIPGSSFDVGNAIAWGIATSIVIRLAGASVEGRNLLPRFMSVGLSISSGALASLPTSVFGILARGLTVAVFSLFGLAAALCRKEASAQSQPLLPAAAVPVSRCKRTLECLRPDVSTLTAFGTIASGVIFNALKHQSNLGVACFNAVSWGVISMFAVGLAVEIKESNELTVLAKKAAPVAAAFVAGLGFAYGVFGLSLATMGPVPSALTGIGTAAVCAIVYGIACPADLPAPVREAHTATTPV